jgi:hypothetical protein
MYTKCHDIDYYIMECVHLRWSCFNITVINKSGVAVCGMIVPDSIGNIRVVEVTEGKWENWLVELEEK